MPLRARTGGSSINKSFNGPGFLQRAGCMQCRRAVPGIGHLDWSQNFYYKLFPDVYDLSIWRIDLRASSTRWRWAKIMNCLRERKSQTNLMFKVYLWQRNPEPNWDFSWSPTKIQPQTFPSFSCSRGSPPLFLLLHHLSQQTHSFLPYNIATCSLCIF